MKVDRKLYRQFDHSFPLDTIIGDVILSKKGEPTVGWELTLPPAYSLTEGEYDDLCMAFMSAVSILPSWTIVHKMDEYVVERYDGEYNGEFLHDSYQKHYEGRKYLKHKSYIFLTLSTKAQCTKNIKNSGIFKFLYRVGRVSKDDLMRFRTQSLEFISILTGNGKIKSRFLTYEDYDRCGQGRGLIQRYLMLGDDGPVTYNPRMSPEKVVIGDKEMISFSISESANLPDEVSTTHRVDSLCGISSEVFLSWGAQLGVLLECNHIVNQYIMTVPQDYAEKELENKNNRMRSGIRNVANKVSSEAIDEFVDAMHRDGLIPVRSHYDVLAWGTAEEITEVRSKVATGLAYMNTSATYNVFDTPILYYAGIPGAAAEMGQQNWIFNHLGAAAAFASFESFDEGIKGGKLWLSDRIRNIPVPIDLSSVAYSAGLIPNYGIKLCGPSGTGKSFFTNKILTDKYFNGEHIFVIDIGDSYESQTQLIRELSNGRDGAYLKWDPEHPFSFNAFFGYEEWVEDSGFLRQEHDGVTFFLSFLRTLWCPVKGWDTFSITVLNQIIQDFVKDFKGKKKSVPVFNDFYLFVSSLIPRIVRKKGEPYMLGDVEITKNKFDIENFVGSMKDYSSSGPYHFLLNNPHPSDLFKSRWTVFEIDKISGKSDDKYDKFFSLCVLCIMNSFSQKMRGIQAYKTMVIEEAWKAIANETMAPFIQSLWKTGRKYSCSPMVVTQQLSDLTSSQIILDTIIQNSAITILLDQRANENNFDEYQEKLGLSSIERNLALSINRGLKNGFNGKQVFISWGGQKFGVYNVEVSLEEALMFESNKQKKAPLLKLAKEKGSIIEATKILAEAVRKTNLY